MANLTDTKIYGNLQVSRDITITGNTSSAGYYVGTTQKNIIWDSAYAHSISSHAPTNAQANQTITAGAGMNFTTTSSNVTITMGKPGTLNASTGNSVSGTTHTHLVEFPSINRSVLQFVASASQTTFNIGAFTASDSIDVYLNGIRLASDDYTLTTPNVILASGASASDIIGIAKYTSSISGGTILSATYADTAYKTSISNDTATNATYYPTFSTVSSGSAAMKTSSSKLTFNPYTGALTATKVYGSVWNDIADFIEIDEDVEIEYGKAYTRNKDGKIIKTTGKKSRVIGIASDTYGFSMGKNNNDNVKQMPIAIGGWVLAYVDKVYKFGTALMASKDGILTKANIKTKILFPERIVGIFDRVETKEEWNGIRTNGRHWVKIN